MRASHRTLIVAVLAIPSAAYSQDSGRGTPLLSPSRKIAKDSTAATSLSANSDAQNQCNDRSTTPCCRRAIHSSRQADPWRRARYRQSTADRVASTGCRDSVRSSSVPESDVADDIRNQDRGQFSALAHGACCRRPSRPFQTVSATSLGGERKTAKAISLIGLGMAAFPCCTDEVRGDRECRPGIR
jgi:hypothetical protein